MARVVALGFSAFVVAAAIASAFVVASVASVDEGGAAASLAAESPPPPAGDIGCGWGSASPFLRAIKSLFHCGNTVVAWICV